MTRHTRISSPGARFVDPAAKGRARWTASRPTAPGLYRTRIRVGAVPAEEDLIAVALLYDGTLAFSRVVDADERVAREWLGPLAFSDLKRAEGGDRIDS